MQGGKGAFEIPKYFGTNITFDREPMSAMEYLISVRNEASQIPDIVSVSLDVINTLKMIIIREIRRIHKKTKCLRSRRRVVILW